MSRTSFVRAVCAFMLPFTLATPRAGALDLDGALALARERAPAVVLAHARLERARGAVAVASVLFADDPIVSATGGPRYQADGGVIPQVYVGIEQSFELSGARDARIAAAEAGVEIDEAGLAEAERIAVASVGEAFVLALHAHQVVEALEILHARSLELLEIGRRLQASGELGSVHVARLELAASDAETSRLSAAADETRALARLRALLDVASAEPLEVEGTWDEVLSAMPAVATARPELDALRARVRLADADRRLADALDVPVLGVGLGYQYEEGDHMGLASLSMTLPVFDRGAGARVVAEAERDAAELELAVRERAIDVELDATRAVFVALRGAAYESARAVARATELEGLARRSFEAGEIGVTDLLAIRAEVLTTLRAHDAHSRDAALARVALEAALGTTRDH